ncbi:MAG: hydroxyacylglutathione hydrolase [Nioella sp.]
MPFEIVTVPCLKDNYAFLAHDSSTGATALVDAPEAAPILSELSARDWTLTDILITHHHWDHVDGLAEIVAATGARTWGNAEDADRLPPLDHAIAPGGTVTVGDESGTMIDVSGHTIGHVAFHFPDSRVAFTADSLMSLGCGRVFEGSPEMMHASLARLAALPPETVICSGHEYTANNAKFALTIDPDNAALISREAEVATARGEGRPTVPSTLQDELDTNPFLRAGDPAIRARLGMQDATDAEVFAEIRARKDAF